MENIINKPFIHYKNKKVYTPIDLCKVQLDGEWIDAVIYIQNSNSGMKFVRTLIEFKEKFSPLP